MIFFYCAAGAFILDQLSKYYIKHLMQFGDSISVLGDFFRITYIHNTGAAFGMLSKMPGATFLLAAAKAAAIAVILLFLKKIIQKGIFYQIGFGLILGGALGNLANRLYYGFIIDFLDFGIGRFRWYIFNIADSSVFIGVSILIIFSMLKKEQ